MSKLDSLFALEFGQLLENHLFASQNREQELDIVISSLGLKSKNQLAQVYAGYDTPTTASIFELIRTLNNPEFTLRFFELKTVNLGVQYDNAVVSKANNDIPTSSEQPSLPRPISGWNGENGSAVCPDRLPSQNTVTSDGFEFDMSLFEIDDD